MNILKKILLGGIYFGAGISLLTPLLVDNNFLFPFISTKVFLFRTAVEIMFLLYVALNVFTSNYRPRFNAIVWLTVLFIAVAIISSLLGGSMYRSFWGDIERGEGIILWLHLLMFLVVLLGVVRTEKNWLILLDVSLGVSALAALFGFGQALGFKSLLATSGTRVDATFGNPAFFATYLLFHIAFACYLFTRRHALFLKTYYGILALLFAWLTAATQTRGTVIGLAAGVLIAAGLFAYLRRDNPKVSKIGTAVVICLILGGGTIFVLRNQPFLRDSPALKRVLSISLQERTAQTRLATWKSASMGLKDKPIFGWGLENFDMVFNKYFPSIIYLREGSQVWFDRAHNVIFDRAVTTGIVGLVVFLALFLYPLYYFVKRFLKDPATSSGAIIFVSFILAYLIQDLFIFESMGIYIILFLTLAFWSATYLPQSRDFKILSHRAVWIILTVLSFIAVGPAVWQVNVRPAKVNAAAAQALRSNPREEDFFVIIDRFKNVINQDTYGLQEYRLQFFEFIDQQLAPVGEVVPKVRPVVEYFDQQAQLQIASEPDNAKNLLLVMRHYNYTYQVYAGREKERLEQALALAPRLIELSPTRPQATQEAGYSHLYLYRLAKNEGDRDAMREHFQAAEKYFKDTIALSPKVVESYVNLIMLYLNSGSTEGIYPVISEMDGRGIKFRSQETISRLLGLAKGNMNYTWIANFAEEATKLNENNAKAWIDLALANAYLGNREKALAVAERVKQFGGSYVSEADEFIRNLNAGVFKTN